MSQSIILCGRSGAGKSESVKHILKYFCSGSDCQAITVDQLILRANPLLESFGNAQTANNLNILNCNTIVNGSLLADALQLICSKKAAYVFIIPRNRTITFFPHYVKTRQQN